MRRVVLRAAAVVAALVCVPAAGAWTWPAGGPVLQPFDFDPLHPYTGGQHRGIDIGADAGTPVFAPAGGTISFAGSVPTSGNSVTIQTPDGLSVTLTHLGTVGVVRNAVVAEGVAVGTIGPSGTPEVAESYVHLGVRVTAQDQGYVDPLAFLPERASVPPPVLEPLAPQPAPVVAAPAVSDPASAAPEEAADPTLLQPVGDGTIPEPPPKDVEADPGVTAESAESAGDAVVPAPVGSAETADASADDRAIRGGRAGYGCRTRTRRPPSSRPFNRKQTGRIRRRPPLPSR